MGKTIVLAICCAVFVGACATSPLYELDPSSGYGTVPRDDMGEPIWDKIQQSGRAAS